MRALSLVFLLGCSASAVSASSASTSSLRVVPHGMVGVSLAGAATAPFETVTAEELLGREKLARDEAARVGPAAEGSPGLFFYGFDADRLVYFSGKTHWRCQGLGCWDYVADKLYVVPRSAHAESTLKVEKVIALYDGNGEVRGGQHQADVRAKLGEPKRIEPLQTFGSERWYYADRTILFLNGEVAGIEAPSR